jgi:RNA polymerase sigma-70 factor, ECF subfamily
MSDFAQACFGGGQAAVTICGTFGPVKPNVCGTFGLGRVNYVTKSGRIRPKQYMLHERDHSDDDLLRRIIAGEEEAFVCFYRRWQGRIYRFALHMSGSASVAEDVTQETFMSVVRDASRFDPTLGSASAYLFGIARNQVLRRLEKDRLLVPFQEPGEVFLEHRPNGGNGHHLASVPPIDLGRKETLARVREAVLSLPQHYREVVVLCDLQEMSYEEAAASLSCAIGTVRSRLHRARILLAAKLEDFRQRVSRTAAQGRVN